METLNASQLRDIGKPVLRIVAHHDHPNSADAKPEQVQNLQSVLKVSIGCRLMLLTNLWTEHGLVDGRQGTLYDIIWPANTDRETVREQMPLCLLVEIEGLQDSCPELFKTNAGDKVVPVFPLRRKLYSQVLGDCSSQLLYHMPLLSTRPGA